MIKVSQKNAGSREIGVSIPDPFISTGAYGKQVTCFFCM